MHTILIIEDNHDIVANLYAFFEPKGYVLDNVKDGVAGLELATTNRYDLIILDILLPKLNGILLCQTLRQTYKNSTPVIMLTAQEAIENRVQGLDSGADDYLVKPFSLIELEARIKALLRRQDIDQTNEELMIGNLRLNPQTHQVHREDISLKLTPTGFNILYQLMLHAPKFMTKSELEEKIWGEDIPHSDALRTHIHTLRQQVDKPFSQSMIITIPGVGYQLNNPGA